MRLDTPCPERELSEMQVVTPYQGNDTLTNDYTIVQENANEKVLGPQLTEPSQISNEIQVWLQIIEQ